MMAVFLDRDGVINKEVDLLHKPEQVELLPGAVESIRRLNERHIKVIVVTNQAVVARGLCTEAELEAIHHHIAGLLAADGARLDAIYSCPYHENANLPQYRYASSDRKPGIGMMERASRDFGVDLTQCVLVGDSTGDVLAGRTAGCRTILVRTGHGGRDGKYPCEPDAIVEALPQAVDLILSEWDPAK